MHTGLRIRDRWCSGDIRAVPSSPRARKMIRMTPGFCWTSSRVIVTSSGGSTRTPPKHRRCSSWWKNGVNSLMRRRLGKMSWLRGSGAPLHQRSLDRNPSVFIRGAGASGSCGIAVARDILREAMQRLARRNAEQADKVHDLLGYLYPGFSEDLSNFRSAFSSAAPAVSRCETLYRERYAAGCSLDYRIIYSSY
jgi:hypothetical protein